MDCCDALKRKGSASNQPETIPHWQKRPLTEECCENVGTGSSYSFGEQWGIGAARSFSIEGDLLNAEAAFRLLPVPQSFIRPLTLAILEDPVATVDGCNYEKSHIEQRFRLRQQEGRPITSPATGLELRSTMLMPLIVSRKAIEVYITRRPELKNMTISSRSFEEAARTLENELLEKQAAQQSY